jgi:DNA-binding CsgD family transcriptional regulator
MNLPAGLEDNSVEIYRFGPESHALYAGKKHSYFDLPPHIRKPFRNEYDHDQIARYLLEHGMSISDDKDREEKFVWCRYGNWDRNPDLVDGKPVADAPNCLFEKTCAGFGDVCLLPKGPNGRLTPQQYFIVKLVALGKQDNEIGDELKITHATVRTHLARIHEKLGANNRSEISLWATNKGLH